MCLVDNFQSCLLLKGFPLRFSGDPDRRFCTRTQYHSSSRGLINSDLEDQSGRYPTKRLGSYGSLGKSKGQPDRYPHPYIRSLTVSIPRRPFARLNFKVLITVYIPRSNDYSYKRNNSVSDVTRNLRNLRPTFEFREQWQYNNQVMASCSSIPSVTQGGT